MDGSADKAYKEKMGRTITARLLSALEQGKVDESEVSLIAGYILDRMNEVETSAEVLSLVNELAEKWPFFNDLLSSQNDEAMEENLKKAEQMENAAITTASDLLKQNKISEALKVVGDATATSASEAPTNQATQTPIQQ